MKYTCYYCQNLFSSYEQNEENPSQTDIFQPNFQFESSDHKRNDFDLDRNEQLNLVNSSLFQFEKSSSSVDASETSSSSDDSQMVDENGNIVQPNILIVDDD